MRLGLGMLKTPVIRHPSGKVRHSGDARNGAVGLGVRDRLEVWSFGWSLARLVRKCSPRPQLSPVSPIGPLKPTVYRIEKDLQTSAQGGGRAVGMQGTRRRICWFASQRCLPSPAGWTTGIRGGKLFVLFSEILFALPTGMNSRNKHALASLGVAIPTRIEQRLAWGATSWRLPAPSTKAKWWFVQSWLAAGPNPGFRDSLALCAVFDSPFSAPDCRFKPVSIIFCGPSRVVQLLVSRLLLFV